MRYGEIEKETRSGRKIGKFRERGRLKRWRETDCNLLKLHSNIFITVCICPSSVYEPYVSVEFRSFFQAALKNGEPEDFHCDLYFVYYYLYHFPEDQPSPACASLSTVTSLIYRKADR